jgi:pSer/pThr/pTyr-binding forkhead associated (FHA) protein
MIDGPFCQLVCWRCGVGAKHLQDAHRFKEFRMRVELIDADARRPKIVIDQLPVIVGLDPGADICLDDSAVGHYQCMIDQSDGDLMVWDLGTRLGTWVNGSRVSRKSVLAPGDQLTIGRSTFTVHFPQEHARTARSAKKGRAAASKARLLQAAE